MPKLEKLVMSSRLEKLDVGPLTAQFEKLLIDLHKSGAPEPSWAGYARKIMVEVDRISRQLDEIEALASDEAQEAVRLITHQDAVAKYEAAPDQHDLIPLWPGHFMVKMDVASGLVWPPVRTRKSVGASATPAPQVVDSTFERQQRETFEKLWRH